MKYLTIFKFNTQAKNNYQFAKAFDSKAAAEKFVKSCAESAKTNALKNTENETFLIEVTHENTTNEITAEIKPIDTTAKYELTYEKNSENIETNYFKTEDELIKSASKILDEYGYEAAPEETRYFHWKVNDSAKNLSVTLRGHLVIMGDGDNNVVASYDIIDLEYFFKHFTDEITKLQVAAKVTKTADLKDARKKGLVNLLVGAGIAALGGILSFVSYNNAKPGESYTIYTGIIVIGIIDAICGIYYLIRPSAALPKDK